MHMMYLLVWASKAMFQTMTVSQKLFQTMIVPYFEIQSWEVSSLIKRIQFP